MVYSLSLGERGLGLKFVTDDLTVFHPDQALAVLHDARIMGGDDECYVVLLIEFDE